MHSSLICSLYFILFRYQVASIAKYNNGPRNRFLADGCLTYSFDGKGCKNDSMDVVEKFNILLICCVLMRVAWDFKFTMSHLKKIINQFILFLLQKRKQKQNEKKT